MASLKDISDFIETQKNLIITIVAMLIGFYCTVKPTQDDFAGQWVGLAIAAAGVYVGHRIEAGKNPPT